MLEFKYLKLLSNNDLNNSTSISSISVFFSKTFVSPELLNIDSILNKSDI